MPRINIRGTIIDFPSSGAAPSWSEGVIAAILALTDAVSSVTGTFDVAPQTQNIDGNNVSNNVSITNLVFPVSEVRSATIYYSVFRKTDDSGPADGVEMVEGGTLMMVYNETNPIGNKWELIRTAAGLANITFNVTDSGQVQFSTTALSGGVNHQGVISYRAIAVLND